MLAAIRSLENYLNHCRECPVCGPVQEDARSRLDHQKNLGRSCKKGQELWHQLPFGDSMPEDDGSLADSLADEFSRILNSWLSPDELTEVCRRNAATEDGSCATHDFCDANQAMIDALTELEIEYFGGQNFLLGDLIDRAWDLARENEFRMR